MFPCGKGSSLTPEWQRNAAVPGEGGRGNLKVVAARISVITF